MSHSAEYKSWPQYFKTAATALYYRTCQHSSLFFTRLRTEYVEELILRLMSYPLTLPFLLVNSVMQNTYFEFHKYVYYCTIITLLNLKVHYVHLRYKLSLS